MSIQKKSKISKGQKVRNKEAAEHTGDSKEAIHTAVLIILIISFTGFSGFALGRLDGNKDKVKSFRVETVAPEVLTGSAIDSVNDDTGKTNRVEETQGDVEAFVVGSKNSTKYHYPWCSGAKRIKPENLVSFPSFEAARQAGYSPAGNCPGLK